MEFKETNAAQKAIEVNALDIDTCLAFGLTLGVLLKTELHNCLIGFDTVGMNLMQASPLMFDWRRVYVEKKRPDYISEFVGVLVSLCNYQRIVLKAPVLFG